MSRHYTVGDEKWMQKFDAVCAELGELACRRPEGIWDGLDAQDMEEISCRAYESENHSEYLICEETYTRLLDIKKEQNK